MKITGTFLVIEDGKAVYKTFEKEVKDYQCLLDLNGEILKLDVAGLRERLADYPLVEGVNFNDLFYNEILNTGSEHILRREKTFWFELPYGVNEELTSEFEEKREKAKAFKERSETLQNVLTRKLLNEISTWVLSEYKENKKAEEVNFYEEKLTETDVAFCKEFYPIGVYSVEFKYRELILIYCSNHGYGSKSYSRLYTKYLNKDFVGKVTIGSAQNVIIHPYEEYSIDKAKEIINDYLADPSAFRKRFYENNVRQLKEALKLEEEKISFVEKTVIPDLQKKIDELKIDTEGEEKNKHEIKKLEKNIENYTKGDPEKIKNYYTNAVAIEDRKLRIELIKAEINDQIRLHNEEENLMKPV